MRLTVGPLPPAVYWRRRAVVLGAVLLFLMVVVYSCGEPAGDRNAGTTGDPDLDVTPTATATALPDPSSSATPQPGATDAVGAPIEGAPGGVPGQPAGPAQTGSAQVPQPPATGAQLCTDEEIEVTPVLTSASVGKGKAVALRIQIKNVSDRGCSRDVGADEQEIYIKAGADKIWSSDSCTDSTGSFLRAFGPGEGVEGQANWNGKRDNRCAAGQSAGDTPKPGKYQVYGRVGSKHSEPVELTIAD